MKNIELRCRNLMPHTYYWPWINISDFTQKDHLITVKIGPYQATLGSQELKLKVVILSDRKNLNA